MGFYPLAGTDRYVLAEPAFDAIELDIGGSEPLTITRTETVETVFLNGEEVESFQLIHSDIADGGQLSFFGEDSAE